MNYDEKKFGKILSYIDQNRKRAIPTTREQLLNNFGEDVFQLTRRLEEKKFLEYNIRRECFYIKDAGINALNTIYNPKWIESKEKEKIESKETEERRHSEILEEQRKATKNQWIGIIIAGTIGGLGLLIAVLK